MQPTIPVIDSSCLYYLLHCSIKEGKHTSLLPRINKLIWGDYHYGTQVLFSTHASPVIPKASPLKVTNHARIFGWFNSTKNIAGTFEQNSDLDARHWNHCENGARLGQGQGWYIAFGHKKCNSSERESAAYDLEVGDLLDIRVDSACLTLFQVVASFCHLVCRPRLVIDRLYF